MQAAELRGTWVRRDILAASLAINLLGIAFPIMILQVYDRVVRDHALPTLGFLAAFVAIAFLLEFALRVLRSRLLGEVGARFVHKKTMQGLSRILAASTETLRNEAPGNHSDRFQAIQQVRNFYTQTGLLLFADLPFVGVFFVLMVLISGWLALVPLVFFAGMIAVAASLSSTMSTVNDVQDKADAKRYNFLIESLTGIHTVKGLTLEPLLQRRHERLQKASAEGLAQITDLSGKVAAISLVFGQLATVATVAFGALAVVYGSLSIGALAATTILTGRMLQPVLRGLTAWVRYQSVRLAEAKVAALEALPAEEDKELPALPAELRGALSVEHVSISYRGGTQPVLQNASLRIAAGEMIGITGSTATGKSTLIHLLCGLLRPDDGRICIDGEDLRSFDPISLRRRIGVLPTHAVIYRGTILENLTGFKDGEIRDRALTLARELGLDEYLASLPQGLDTFIGGSETLVPTGVAKRIAIVRVLATDPAIILFDNAHAGFDQDSDERLRRYFARCKGQRTIVLISQRPSYLSLCDRLFGLREGAFVPFSSVQDATTPPPAEREAVERSFLRIA